MPLVVSSRSERRLPPISSSSVTGTPSGWVRSSTPRTGTATTSLSSEAGSPNLTWSFSQAASQVIAIDGMYVRRPFRPDPIELAPGNRVDLDITIPRDASAGHKFQIVDRFTRRPFAIAVLRVEDVPVDTPSFAVPFNARVPAWSRASELGPDLEFLRDAQPGGPYGHQWTINGEPWGQHEPIGLRYSVWAWYPWTGDAG
jgi:hypothetical protein